MVHAITKAMLRRYSECRHSLLPYAQRVEFSGKGVGIAYYRRPGSLWCNERGTPWLHGFPQRCLVALMRACMHTTVQSLTKFEKYQRCSMGSSPCLPKYVEISRAKTTCLNIRLLQVCLTWQGAKYCTSRFTVISASRQSAGM